MITSSHTKAVLIGGVIFFLVAVGGFLGSLYYLDSMNTDIALLEHEVESERASAKAILSLEKTLNQNASNIDRIDDFIVTTETEADFIKSIEQIATTSNVTFEISTFSHEEIPNNKNFELAVVHATAVGSISDIIHFLKILEVFPKKMVIHDLDLQVLTIGSKKQTAWKLVFIAKALKSK
jgi:hypothetical protein